ncbi:hypothetical protein TL16_g06676 [Triparma laevis f. inornata]|uniref:Uncharacterized protein n=2 Tax=Triparma laevis TaxID=1534972 RepID=A0A9W7KSC5_9STRA|nr:hypothetical protein TL16_g06676 [Triparma laevis f. inornata]GMI09873.1 hypothetical protein TrLO_g15278 [Triparma laevis f. longispina]
MFPLTDSHESRRLKFDTAVCPKIVDEFFGEDSERAQEEDEAELSGKELSQGGDAVGFLSDLRSGAGDFYETVLHNIMIYMCEQDIDVNEERCVEFGEAAKDYAGHCVIPDSSPCDATLTSRSEEDVGSGTCERASNCYWDVPVEGETRESRYTDKEALDNEEYLIGASMDSYIGKTAKYLVVGVVLAVLNILIWTIFTIGRCCCCCLHSVCFCRCCSWKPKEEGYNTGCQVRFPIFMYIAFLAAIVGSAGVAFVGDKDVGKAFDSLFDNSRAGLSDMQSFLGKANTPMQAIGGLVDDAADASIDILDGTDYVEYGMSNVILRINDFATVVYADGITKAGATDQIDTTLSSLGDVETEVVDSVREILDTLRASLVDGKDDMATALADASDKIVKLNTTVDGFFTDINDLDEQVEDIAPIRQLGILSTFAISLVCVAFGFLGVLSYWTPCKWDDILIYLMNLTWFFGSIIVTLSFILAGITIFLSVFWNDTCHWLDIVVQDFEPYVGSAASVGLNACFNNTPLVDAFNLTSKVDFQDTINSTLAEIENTDLDAQFEGVAAPLEEINDMIKGILTADEFQTVVNSLDAMTNYENGPADCSINGEGAISTNDCNDAKAVCNFNVNGAFVVDDWEGDDSTELVQLDLFQEPWSLVENILGAGATAQWFSKTSLAADINVARAGSETGVQYMARVFQDTAGICGGDFCGAASLGDPCNTGADCSFLCTTIEDTIQTVWAEIVDARALVGDMLIDLGVEYFDDSGSEPVFCPSGTSTPTLTCPTAAFQTAGNARTVKQELYNFQANITATTNDIVNIANSAVGDIMDQVTIFLCNMECGFVADLYNNVHNDLCGTLLGGVLQISAGFWFLALFMFLNSALGALLVVRMRGISKADYEERDEGSGVEMKGVSLDLYN